MSLKTKAYIHYFIPESRREINEPMEDFMTIVPDTAFVAAYKNRIGHVTSILGSRLYFGGIIDYRTDSPCIEVWHENKKGIEKLAKELCFFKFMKSS